MTGLRWAGTKRAVAVLTALTSALFLVYISLTPPLPPPIVSITPPPSSQITNNPVANNLVIATNQLIATNPPSSASSAAPPQPSSPPAKPVQPPVPSVIYAKDIYEAGHQTPHPEICPYLGKHLKLLILITSAPDHDNARNAVRLTWGHFSRRSDLAFAFVLGSPPENLRQSLIEEDSLYGDLIIGNSIDSYSNLTLKTISMLEWASTYCPRVPHMLKTDDDMFINIPRLLNFLQFSSVANASKVIWGKKMKRSLPKRAKTNKYYVPPAQYPGKMFPDFVSGPAYLLTGDCILPLLEAAPEERYLRLEDVFVTGILAQRAGITRRHDPQFYNRKVAPHPCAIQRGISIHMVRYHEQFDMWKKLLDGRFACPTPAKKPAAVPAPANTSGNSTS